MRCQYKTKLKLHRMKIFGIVRLPRGLLNKTRLRVILSGLIAFSFFYHVLPQLLFKVPPSKNRFRDPDFPRDLSGLRHNNGFLQEEAGKKEIVILHWTATWRTYYSPKVLNAETCSNLEGATVQPITTGVFNIPCRISYDRRYMQVADALIMHSFDLMWEELPKRDNYNQLWVYMQQESPIYTKLNLQDYTNVFNWTMTFRRDSDVYHPYGHIVPRTNQSPNITTNSSQNSSRPLFLSNKRKLVAWIVSSCDSYSKREYFVQELKKYAAVDVFGWCGNDCPSYSGDCYSYVQSTYKFYLSFENSLCTDYITEKFFSALNSNMVPIVYGGSQATDYSSIAPKHSYIDARAFNSPKDLADYLLYLDKNDKEYLEYFEWKQKFQLVTTHLGWCNLCQRVYEHMQRVPAEDNKWYKDLWKWWNYMSYDTDMEVDEHTALSQTALIGQSYYYKLGAPACLSPPKKFTEGGTKTRPDLEPGLLNGRIFGKLFGWARDAFSTG